jgi:hypothetical protein
LAIFISSQVPSAQAAHIAALYESNISGNIFKVIAICDFDLFVSVYTNSFRFLRGIQQFKREACSETTLTVESRFHISPPRGFEPVTLVAGSKQVSPLDQ